MSRIAISSTVVSTQTLTEIPTQLRELLFGLTLTFR